MLATQADLGVETTIVAVATKGRGGKDGLEQNKQWVKQYKLAVVVNDNIIYYTGPLKNGMVCG